MLTIIPIPAFKDNYIWLLLNPANNNCVVVDPGDATPVLDVLHTSGYKLQAILVTHHHHDHCGGVLKLLQHYQVPVYGSANEETPGVDHRVTAGDIIQLPTLDLNLQVFSIPGHTLGHVAYYGNGMLFSGDTLFTGGCGRVFEGTHTQLYDSLQCLAALPDETLVYCGHEYTAANMAFAAVVEPENALIQQRGQQAKNAMKQGVPTVPSHLSLEKQTNPFLRCHIPAVLQAAEAFSGHKMGSPEEICKTLRGWKDGF